MRSRYPLGVVVVIVIMVLRCLTIGAGLTDTHGNLIADWLRASSPVPAQLGADLEIVARAVLIVILIASVLVVFGLLAGRHWAWVLAIVSCGAILAIDIGWWVAGDARYGSMFLNVIAVFYLNQRDVRLALRGVVEP